MIFYKDKTQRLIDVNKTTKAFEDQFYEAVFLDYPKKVIKKLGFQMKAWQRIQSLDIEYVPSF